MQRYDGGAKTNKGGLWNGGGRRWWWEGVAEGKRLLRHQAHGDPCISADFSLHLID